MMKRGKKHRLWIVGVMTLAVLSFLAGTTLACFHIGAGNITVAEDCCQSHCQHVMVGKAATDCCQHHQVQNPQSVVASTTTKHISGLTQSLSFSFLVSLVPQESGLGWTQFLTTKRPPPLLP